MNELQNSTRTVFGNEIQACHNLGIRYLPLDNTTLNQKWEVHTGTSPSESSRHSLEFYCIGNGGHVAAVGPDNIPYTSPIKHDPRDAALYRHLPFIMLPINEDFTVDDPERNNYALRKAITVSQPGGGSVNYWAYYAKRINKTNAATATSYVQVQNGNETVTPFIPDTGNLFPVPPVVPNTGSVNTTGDYLSTSTVLTIPFTVRDVEYLKSVARNLYNLEDLAVISEVGLISGIRQNVNLLNAAGQPVSGLYYECLQSTIANHIPCYYPVKQANAGFDLQLELGMTEPLSAPTSP